MFIQILKNIFLFLYFGGIICIIGFSIFGVYLGCGMSPKCNMLHALLGAILLWICPWVIILLTSFKHRKDIKILLSAFLPILLIIFVQFFLVFFNLSTKITSSLLFIAIPYSIIVTQVHLIKKSKYKIEKGNLVINTSL